MVFLKDKNERGRRRPKRKPKKLKRKEKLKKQILQAIANNANRSYRKQWVVHQRDHQSMIGRTFSGDWLLTCRWKKLHRMEVVFKPRCWLQPSSTEDKATYAQLQPEPVGRVKKETFHIGVAPKTEWFWLASCLVGLISNAPAHCNCFKEKNKYSMEVRDVRSIIPTAGKVATGNDVKSPTKKYIKYKYIL